MGKSGHLEHAERMKRQVVILGAGFGGLELSTLLSERLAEELEVTLIDQNDAFTIGFSKLDLLFRNQTRDDVRLPYRRLAKRGVTFRQETVVSIDPQRRRVATDGATYEADFLVVALGADYDPAATPGFVEGGFEYYSVEGAERLRDELPSFRGGKVLLAVLSIPFKCPPAPYEGILLLHDYLVERGIRDATRLHVVTPQPAPIPVSAEASKAVERTMAARGIEYTKRRRVYGIDPADKLAHFKDHDEPYDLFIGIPVHKVRPVFCGDGRRRGGPGRRALPGRGRAHSSTAGTQPGVRRREGRIRSSPSRPVVRPIAPSRHHRSGGGTQKPSSTSRKAPPRAGAHPCGPHGGAEPFMSWQRRSSAAAGH